MSFCLFICCFLQAAEPTYQQPVSTGNLYYYYYPVAAQPIVEKSDSDDLDPIVLVLLPVAALVGLLALLSIFSESNTLRNIIHTVTTKSNIRMSLRSQRDKLRGLMFK